MKHFFFLKKDQNPTTQSNRPNRQYITNTIPAQDITDFFFFFSQLARLGILGFGSCLGEFTNASILKSSQLTLGVLDGCSCFHSDFITEGLWKKPGQGDCLHHSVVVSFT